MNKVELLLPAGSVERMEYAIAYGADAVYLGISDFSLRNVNKGNIITSENIKSSIQIAHDMGAKAYSTLNIFAHNDDIKNLNEKLDIIVDARPDGIIFSDPGIFNVIKSKNIDIDLHVSTQANTLNYETVKFWRDQGVKRVILARELSLKEIAEIKQKVPDIEIECFVHGAQCVSYSGRCLLSDYMTHNERNANQGGCAQPCRWNYKLLEETRPGEYYDIQEDSHGAYILSPKDLNLIKLIPQLIDAGVDSLKVEGRNKSIYYVSSVAKTYKTALNAHYNNQSIDYDALYDELTKIGNRRYTTGFLLNKADENERNYIRSKGIAGEKFLAMILDSHDKQFKVLIKNKILLNDIVEIISPDDQLSAKVTGIKNQYGEDLIEAKTNDELMIELDIQGELKTWNRALIRTIGQKLEE